MTSLGTHFDGNERGNKHSPNLEKNMNGHIISLALSTRKI